MPGMELERLLDVWEKLGERERKILLTFMYRLYNGQRKYGKLTLGKKEWAYEAIEEALDASVYLSALLSDKVDQAFGAAVADAEREVCEAVTVKEESGTTLENPPKDVEAMARWSLAPEWTVLSTPTS